MATEEILKAVLALDLQMTAKLVQVEMEQGTDVMTILNEALIAAMDEVGRRFSQGVFFVPEMLMAARAMKGGVEILRPHLVGLDVEPKGTIVIGTVKGDHHDIGKNLVAMMLECAGFKLIDLGVNVDKVKFLAAAKRNNADMIALSALLTTTLPAMEAIVAAVQASDNDLKILVGGAPVDQNFAAKIGADGYSLDAAGAVTIARHLLFDRVQRTDRLE